MTGTPIDVFSELQDSRWEEGAKSLEGGAAYTAIIKRLATHGSLLNNLGAFRTVAARIPDLLRLDFGVIVVGGWKKVAELRRYTDREKYSPDESVLVDVTRHTITSTHKPTLDIVVNGKKVDAVPFELKLTITIDGASLTIRDGKIEAITPLACKAGGELKCEGYTILKRDAVPIKLPGTGTWKFKEPIAISSVVGGVS